MRIGEYSVKLQIWDTAGQERYRTITNAYYRGADGIIVVFDLSNKETFLTVSDWLEEVKKCAPEDTLIIVFANKWDLYDERQVSEEDIKSFEEKTGIQVIETSAKSAENVDKGFLFLTTKLIEKRQKDGDSFENDGSDQFYNPGYGGEQLNAQRFKQITLKDGMNWCNN